MNWRLLVTLITLCLFTIIQSTALARRVSSQKGEPGVEDFYLPFQEHTRHFSVYTPSNHSQKPIPAVFIFHGYGMDDRQMMQMTRFNTLAEKEGFLAVYPQGRDKMWNSKGVPNDLTEDVDFVDAALAKLMQTRSVDAQHIYATGFSNGGLFVQRLACEMPGRFAAFATVSATIGRPQSEGCSQAIPAPLLMIHGTKDPIVSWQGRIHPLFLKFRTSRLLSVPDTLNLWLARNGCDAKPSNIKREAGKQKNLSLEERDFNTCRSNKQITQLIVHGGGHIWPGSGAGTWFTPLYLGKTYHALDATTYIWDFFKQF
jgi:polyhydroxybutyrate depolymerase